MKNRTVSGAACVLIIAVVFVFLRYRVEAVAQQYASGDSESSSADSFQNEPRVGPRTATADAAADADPFGSDTRESSTDGESLPPAGTALPDPFTAIVSGPDRETEDAAQKTHREKQPKQVLEVIQLRYVDAGDVYQVVRNVFDFRSGTDRVFLASEEKSNRLIVKASAGMVRQIRELAEKLDRFDLPNSELANGPRTYEIPDVPQEDSTSESAPESLPWSLRIIQLRNVDSDRFEQIASRFMGQQVAAAEIHFSSIASINCVVVRGSEEQLAQIQRLAEQLDRPADDGAASDVSGAMPGQSGGRVVPESISKDEWLTRPAGSESQLHAERIREQIATLDRESLSLAKEVKTMQREYGEQHPKLVESSEKLKTLLEKSFQLRLQLQKREVSAIRTRLERIESQVQQREQLRQEIIARRFRELLGEHDNLRWDVTQSDRRAAPVEMIGPGMLLHGMGSTVIREPLESTQRLAARRETSVTSTPGIPGISPARPLIEAESQSEAASSIPLAEREILSGQLKLSSVPETSVAQQELIMAKHALDVAGLRMEQAERQLSRFKNGSAEYEQCEFDRDLARLEMKRAEKLLDATHRSIHARREALRLELLQRQKNVEAAAAASEQGLAAADPDTNPVSEFERRRLLLELDAARLGVEQVKAELRSLDGLSEGSGQEPDPKDHTTGNTED